MPNGCGRGWSERGTVPASAVRRAREEHQAPEFHLWRPMLDLSDADDATPHSALSTELAYMNMRATPEERLPIQSRPGPSLRERITESGSLREYACDTPSALPEHLRTARWRELVDWCEEAEGTDPVHRGGLASLLASLGLYRYLASWPLPDHPDDPHALQLAVGLTHARSVVDRTGSLLASSVEALERVMSCGDLPPATRLGAATTLVVLHSQSRLKDVDRVTGYCREAARHAEVLDPDKDWRDLLHLSTYWRAVSFAPFLHGDLRETDAQLDRAEAHARRLPEGTPQERWVRAQNFHPLLETRTKVATALGDLDRALAFSRELRDRDWSDGKVHIQLGDVHRRRGEPALARDAYLAAVPLGAPFRALAWSKAAQLSGDEDAVYALMCAYRGDPRSVTPLLLQERVSRARGDDRLADWAGRTAMSLREDRSNEEAQCVPLS